MPEIRIDYYELLLLLLCMGFFVKGAHMDMRSPVLWGALSLAMWLLFTQFLGFGIFGALLSQFLLLMGLTAWEMLRERRAKG